jgi:cytochrome c-type biogenesis protein CcmH
MTTFFMIALVIALAGSALVLAPMLRSHFAGQDDDKRPGITLTGGIMVALLLPLLALFLYSRWTTWDWSAAAEQAAQASDEQMHSMEQAVASLEARLVQQPDDIEGWRMLGRSYMSMRRFDKAAVAYRKALELSGGDQIQPLADYGEALFLSDPSGMRGDAGPLFRDLVARAPDNPKVMWYGGLAAFEAGDEGQGRDLWSRLLTMNPPEAMRRMIEERIGPVSAVPGSSPPVDGQPLARAGAPAGSVAEGAIRLNVSLDPALEPRVNAGAPLFVFARRPAGGPPLAAVRKSAADLPLVLDISDANAMMQGIKISDQQELTLVARLSMTGSPREQSGDLFGKVEYRRGDGNQVAIRIDQIVP